MWLLRLVVVLGWLEREGRVGAIASPRGALAFQRPTDVLGFDSYFRREDVLLPRGNFTVSVVACLGPSRFRSGNLYIIQSDFKFSLRISGTSRETASGGLKLVIYLSLDDADYGFTYAAPLGFDLDGWHRWTVTYSSGRELLKIFVDDECISEATAPRTSTIGQFGPGGIETLQVGQYGHFDDGRFHTLGEAQGSKRGRTSHL